MSSGLHILKSFLRSAIWGRPPAREAPFRQVTRDSGRKSFPNVLYHWYAAVLAINDVTYVGG